MTDPVFEPDSAEAAALAQAGMREILEWLDTPPSLEPADELSPLRAHLLSLREIQASTHQRAEALDRLYARGVSVAARLLPALADVALPVPRKIRQMVRSLQDMLRMLADDMPRTLGDFDEHLTRGLHRPKELTLWRTLHALAQHLLISDLIASPSGAGIWQQLHQTYAIARGLDLAERTPEGEQSSLRQIYFSALLLGCAQPASFSSREISFVADYLKRFADCAEPLSEAPADSAGTFWTAPFRDAPPFACARKTATPDASVFYFSCDRLADLLKKQLAALNAGSTAQQVGLPAFADTTTGHGVLRRLANYWGQPGKRRFQRRRQNYRAVLCAGLESLWQRYRDDDTNASDVSSWMITNESPDGYAIMHVIGKTGKLVVGDITAIRTESGKDWQICLVRWALSENPEHLELGLQILSPRAIPAILALQTDAGGVSRNMRLPALILPETPPLRLAPTLVVPAGALRAPYGRLILIIEQGNIEIREVNVTRLEEQTASVEVFSIQPDGRPAPA